MQVFLCDPAFSLGGYVSRNGIAGSYDNLIFWGPAILFSKVCAILRSHQQCTKGLISTHPCQQFFLFLFCFVLDSSHLNGYEVVSHNFDLHYFNDAWYWTSFHVFIGHKHLSCACLYVIFGEMSIQTPCPCLNRVALLLLMFRSFLYSRYLSRIRKMVCKYFFHSVGFLFTLFWLDAQNFLIFMKSSLYNFSFVASAFGVIAGN